MAAHNMIRRVLVATAGTAGLALLGVMPASAAPPSNDVIGGATVIDGVPFQDTVDTTDAGVGPNDFDLGNQCGYGGQDVPLQGSVWYRITPDVAGLRVDASASDFATAVMAATGTPGNLRVAGCGLETLTFSTTAGTSYYINVFSADLAVEGGQLSVEVTEGAPPPEVSLQVDPTGEVNPDTGVATLHGTYTCTGEAERVFVAGVFYQGDHNGTFELDDLPCAGTRSWHADVESNWTFVPGAAKVDVDLGGCLGDGCDYDSVYQKPIELEEPATRW